MQKLHPNTVLTCDSNAIISFVEFDEHTLNGLVWYLLHEKFVNNRNVYIPDLVLLEVEPSSRPRPPRKSKGNLPLWDACVSLLRQPASATTSELWDQVMRIRKEDDVKDITLLVDLEKIVRTSNHTHGVILSEDKDLKICLDKLGWSDRARPAKNEPHIVATNAKVIKAGEFNLWHLPSTAVHHTDDLDRWGEPLDPRYAADNEKIYSIINGLFEKELQSHYSATYTMADNGGLFQSLSIQPQFTLEAHDVHIFPSVVEVTLEVDQSTQLADVMVQDLLLASWDGAALHVRLLGDRFSADIPLTQADLEALWTKHQSAHVTSLWLQAPIACQTYENPSTDVVKAELEKLLPMADIVALAHKLLGKFADIPQIESHFATMRPVI
jgi:hypothetical protein